MIEAKVLPSEVATLLGCNTYTAEEVLRRLFLTTTQYIFGATEKKVERFLRVNIAEKPSEFSGQINRSDLGITVQHRGWLEGNKIKDKATLMTYIQEAAPQVLKIPAKA